MSGTVEVPSPKKNTVEVGRKGLIGVLLSYNCRRCAIRPKEKKNKLC